MGLFLCYRVQGRGVLVFGDSMWEDGRKLVYYGHGLTNTFGDAWRLRFQNCSRRVGSIPLKSLLLQSMYSSLFELYCFFYSWTFSFSSISNAYIQDEPMNMMGQYCSFSAQCRKASINFFSSSLASPKSPTTAQWVIPISFSISPSLPSLSTGLAATQRTPPDSTHVTNLTPRQQTSSFSSSVLLAITRATGYLFYSWGYYQWREWRAGWVSLWKVSIFICEWQGIEDQANRDFREPASAWQRDGSRLILASTWANFSCIDNCSAFIIKILSSIQTQISKLIILNKPMSHTLSLHTLQLIGRILGIIDGHSFNFLVRILFLFLLLQFLFLHYCHRATVEGLQLGEFLEYLVSEDDVFLLALEEWVDRIFQCGQILQAAEPVQSLLQEHPKISKAILISREGLQPPKNGKITQRTEQIIIDDESDQICQRLEVQATGQLIAGGVQMFYIYSVADLFLGQLFQVAIDQVQHLWVDFIIGQDKIKGNEEEVCQK